MSFRVPPPLHESISIGKTTKTSSSQHDYRRTRWLALPTRLCGFYLHLFLLVQFLQENKLNSNRTQCNESILIEIIKPFNKIFTGFKDHTSEIQVNMRIDMPQFRYNWLFMRMKQKVTTKLTFKNLKSLNCNRIKYPQIDKVNFSEQKSCNFL